MSSSNDSQLMSVEQAMALSMEEFVDLLNRKIDIESQPAYIQNRIAELIETKKRMIARRKMIEREWEARAFDSAVSAAINEYDRETVVESNEWYTALMNDMEIRLACLFDDESFFEKYGGSDFHIDPDAEITVRASDMKEWAQDLVDADEGLFDAWIGLAPMKDFDQALDSGRASCKQTLRGIDRYLSPLRKASSPTLTTMETTKRSGN
ncbi:hypothetical protein F4819DRAFT_488972 [Hypoxylon fuscum]|nr:hypothetical protein F4819DRAFT_488972 [Hypoxylon fuscum]